MNVAIINQTIRAMCLDVEAHGSSSCDWRLLTEDQLLYEAAICIFGSQILFEMAVATADRLQELGLIRSGLRGMSAEDFERRVADALSDPLPMIDGKGRMQWVRPRFKNRLASLLTSTVVEVYEGSLALIRSR
jgi:N-glycosylase/DNA lyase